MANRVTVEVPATSANLGPGFDSLGVALDWTARWSFEPARRQERPSNAMEQMALSAALAIYQRAGVNAPAGIDVTYDGDIPVGRGLGISAAARVAGVVAANALLEADYEPAALLGVAVQLEGHADNAAPAMLGALQVVASNDDEFEYLRVELPDALRLVVLVPDFSMPTNESRRLLPDRFTRNQAVHNIGRAAMLVGALATGQFEALKLATEDLIHQPARAQLFQPMFQIFQAARDAGAHGVYLSGGGSTVAAFASDRFDDIAGAMREAAASHGQASETRVCAFNARGASIVEA